MKKIFVIIVFLFIGLFEVSAEKISVKFSKCVDGDTAKFIYKNEEITARFLAIDTPETVHPTKEVEEYGKEASDYTCNKIKNAKKIVLEYDNDSDKFDKYDRHLVWVFVDNSLLQKELVSNGLASVAYLYGDYKYTNDLEAVEQKAEDKKLGIWSIDQNEENDKEIKPKEKKDDKEKENNEKESLTTKEIIMLLGVVIIVCTFSTKARKKVKKDLKKEIKKRLKK